MISAAKIDGQQLFSDGVEIEFDRSSVEGPILLWLISNEDSGMLILPKNNSNDGYMWRSINKAKLNYCMDFLIPTISDYVDYQNGATVTFQISTQTIPSNDIVTLKYSPYMKKADNKAGGSLFSDANLFCKEVKSWANAIMNN